MRIIPKSPFAQLTFFETHLPVWSQDPGAIGLSPQAVADLAALQSAAKAAYDAAISARNAAHGATEVMHARIAAMVSAGSNAVAAIKSAARSDQSIYARARVPAPAMPAPAPPPTAPRSISATINSEGHLRLAWTGAGPTGTSHGLGARGGAGTQFVISRQSPGAPPRQVAVTAERYYIDEQPPLAPGAPLTYRVTVRRGRKVSEGGLSITVSLPAPSAGQTTDHARAALPTEGRRAA